MSELIMTHRVIPAMDFSKAKCRGMPTSWWFPTPESKRKLVKQAKQVCSQCEVSMECRDYGQATLSSGVWGGITLSGGRHKISRIKPTKEKQ